MHILMQIAICTVKNHLMLESIYRGPNAISYKDIAAMSRWYKKGFCALFKPC